VNGSGGVWMSNLKIEPVGTDVPTTSKTTGTGALRPDGPQNLNFEQ
jgi:hypothetical protein